jgi:N-acetylneuraminic acid mutarotase
VIVFSNMKKIKSKIVILLILSFSMSTFTVPYALAADDYWETMTEMPTARYGLGVAVVNGKIYPIGGFNGGYLGINEMYDPATDTWTTKTPMPTPREHFGIAAYENKIYCIGGSVENVVVVGANEVYDPLTDTWETKTLMPTNRSHLDANVVDGKIFLIGGYRYSSQDSPSSHAFNLNEVYDPSTDTWSTKEPCPRQLIGTHLRSLITKFT